MLDVVGRHLQVRLVHELRPAEAVRAVRVAGLALPGEEQHGLRVLVLQAGQRPAVQARRVQQQLAGRVRVEPHPDLVRGGAQGRPGRLAADHVRQPLHVGRGQHVGLGENQAVDRVVRGRVPVDQVLDDIGIRPEREHRRHGPYGQPLVRRQAGPLHEHVQVFRRVGMKPAAGGPGRRDDLLDVCHAPSPSSCARHGGRRRPTCKIALMTPAPQRSPRPGRAPGSCSARTASTSIYALAVSLVPILHPPFSR